MDVEVAEPTIEQDVPSISTSGSVPDVKSNPVPVIVIEVPSSTEVGLKRKVFTKDNNFVSTYVIWVF